MNRKPIKNIKRQLSEFVRIHDIVDFGSISEHDELLRLGGLSRVKGSNDHYYAHGNVAGRELTVVAREFGFNSTTKTAGGNYLWAMLAFQLEVSDLPSVYIDSQLADQALQTHLLKVVGSHSNISQLFRANASFSAAFKVFGQPQQAVGLQSYMNQPVMQMLYDHYQNLSFEITQDKLFIYSDHQTTDLRHLNKMLEAGLWLSEHLEYADAALHHHQVSLNLQIA